VTTCSSAGTPSVQVMAFDFKPFARRIAPADDAVGPSLTVGTLTSSADAFQSFAARRGPLAAAARDCYSLASDEIAAGPLP
jgi:hypothetical protein